MMLAETLLVAAMAGSVIQVAAARLVARFAALPSPAPIAKPPVTILRSLRGAEPGLPDNLRSLWRQDWAVLRLVCGVADMADPAAEAVRRLQAEFPGGDIRLMMGGAADSANPRAAALAAMLPEAGDGVVVAADPGMEAPADLVPALVAALDGRKAGLATCLYCVHPAGNIWSQLGAEGVNHLDLPLTLLARVLGYRAGCLSGATAVPRAVLDSVGGFAPLTDRLSETHALSGRIRALGLDSVLAVPVLRAHVCRFSLSALMAEEIRRARSCLALAPLAHLASLLLQPVALALLGNLAAGFAGKAPLVLAAAVMVRLVTSRMIDTALDLRSAPLWLLPVREGLSFAVFVAAFCGRTVTWHGRRLRIGRRGTLTPDP